MVSMNLELYYRSELTSGTFADMTVNLYTRTSSTNLLIFKSYLLFHYNSLVSPPSAEVSMKNGYQLSLHTTSAITLATSLLPKIALGLRYQIIKVRNTILDSSTSFQTLSYLLGGLVSKDGVTIQLTDQHFVGNSRFTSTKLSNPVYPYFYLVIAEVMVFINTYVYRNNSGAVIACFESDSLYLNCNNPVQGIKRSEYTTPKKLIYASCTSESIIDVCSLPG